MWKYFTYNSFALLFEKMNKVEVESNCQLPINTDEIFLLEIFDIDGFDDSAYTAYPIEGKSLVKFAIVDTKENAEQMFKNLCDNFRLGKIILIR